MRSQRLFPGVFVLMFLLSIFLCGFEAVKVETVSKSGSVQQVDKDFKFIVVNGEKMIIGPHTKIVDEKGNKLSREDVKPKAYLTTESVRHRDGYSVNKIVVKTPKKGQ